MGVNRDLRGNVVPYHHPEAEMSSIGAMMLSERALKEVRNILDGSDFYIPAHRTIFEAIVALDKTGVPIDFNTLKYRLEQTPASIAEDALDEVGGIDYLVQVCHQVPSAANARYYADIVKAESQKRMLQYRAESIIKQLENDPDKAVLEASEILRGIEHGGAEHADWAAAVASAQTGLPKGVPWFLPKVNATSIIGGVPKNDMTLIGAFTGAGKSTMMAQQSVFALRQGYRGAIVSLEMSAQEIAWKMLKQITGMDSLHHAEGCGAGDSYRNAIDEVARYDLEVYDGSKAFDDPVRISQMFNWLTDVHYGKALDFVCIDYLQIIGQDKGEPDGPSHQHAISRRSRAWARKFDCAVIGLAQIEEASNKRGWEWRYGRKFGEDATTIFVKSRGKTEDGEDGEIFIVQKARWGKTCRFEVLYDEHYQTLGQA